MRDIGMRSVCRPLRSVVPNVDHHFHQHRFHAPADFLQPIQSRADFSQLRCCVCCYWRRLLQAAAAALAEPSLAVGVCSCGSAVCKCGSCGCSKGQRWLPLRRRVRRRRRRQRRSCGTRVRRGCWLLGRRRVQRRRRRQRWQSKRAAVFDQRFVAVVAQGSVCRAGCFSDFLIARVLRTERNALLNPPVLASLALDRRSSVQPAAALAHASCLDLKRDEG